MLQHADLFFQLFLDVFWHSLVIPGGAWRFAPTAKRRLYDGLFSAGSFVCKSGVKETLQDEHCGDLVNHLAPFPRLVAGRIQMPVRFGGREPFVPQGHGNTGFGLQVLGQSLCLERLGADVSRHIQRVPHHHLFAPVFAHQPAQGAEVLTPVLAHQGQHWLGGETEFIRDRDPNPAIAHVQPQNPSHIH
jgi:hypothetical protein